VLLADMLSRLFWRDRVFRRRGWSSESAKSQHESEGSDALPLTPQ
jgi:hypothetical protein